MTTILIVDDDPAVLLNTSAYLEDEGFDVLEAKTAQEALTHIEANRPDLGVIDMRLPGMDGNELILQAHDIHPTMQFIIHTGSTDYVLPDELKALGIGAEQVVNKPVPDMVIFNQVIDKLLNA